MTLPVGLLHTRLPAPVSLAVRCPLAVPVLLLAVPVLLLAVLLVALTAMRPGLVAAHGGELDEWGGHFDEKTHFYHYHRPARDMAVRKRDWLTWERLPVSGEIRGRVASVDGPDGFWLYVAYRPAYQELVQAVLPANRDDRAQRVRIRLSYVAPDETGARDPRFAEHFRTQVVDALRQKLQDREVRVAFRLAGSSPGWLRGVVFVGDENVNLWMVGSGWSYYVLTDDATPDDVLYRHAEDAARAAKAGIWASEH